MRKSIGFKAGMTMDSMAMVKNGVGTGGGSTTIKKVPFKKNKNYGDGTPIQKGRGTKMATPGKKTKAKLAGDPNFTSHLNISTFGYAGADDLIAWSPEYKAPTTFSEVAEFGILNALKAGASKGLETVNDVVKGKKSLKDAANPIDQIKGISSKASRLDAKDAALKEKYPLPATKTQSTKINKAKNAVGATIAAGASEGIKTISDVVKGKRSVKEALNPKAQIQGIAEKAKTGTAKANARDKQTDKMNAKMLVDVKESKDKRRAWVKKNSIEDADSKVQGQLSGSDPKAKQLERGKRDDIDVAKPDKDTTYSTTKKKSTKPRENLDIEIKSSKQKTEYGYQKPSRPKTVEGAWSSQDKKFPDKTKKKTSRWNFDK